MVRYGIPSTICLLTFGVAGIFCLSAFWKTDLHHTRISTEMCLLPQRLGIGLGQFLPTTPAILITAPFNCNQTIDNVIYVTIPSPIDEPACCSGKAIWILNNNNTPSPLPIVPICFGAGMIIIVAITIILEVGTFLLSRPKTSSPHCTRESGPRPAIIIVSNNQEEL